MKPVTEISDSTMLPISCCLAAVSVPGAALSAVQESKRSRSGNAVPSFQPPALLAAAFTAGVATGIPQK